ncbi:MAG: DUF4445 domain-containing protein [Acidimicrobiaceae bacterium]|nr:DUF4445 domain-containing protein [Acidimicrobiaceae bacterium]MYE75860.1 DUF4445 domain-containing protein [Acidimicrobiaceae bacterium]
MRDIHGTHGTHSVVFNPSGIRAPAAAGATVLDAARAGGVDLDSVCGGRGLCGRCQVSAAEAGALSDPGPTELRYRGRRPIAEGFRLGCQAVVLADAAVDVPPESQVHRPVVRKSIDLAGVVVDPVVTLHYLELPEVLLGAEAAEADLVAGALAADWGLAEVEFPVPVLASLSPAIAAGDRAVTVVVHGRRTVLDVRPGYSDEAWGVAVDVGSTTVAGYLLELASGEVAAASGRMNPQIRFGEDLMSRVSYVMMNPGGEAELSAAVRTAIDELVGELCGLAGADRGRVHDLVVVGNPIMHHLVLGLDPTPLGAAPFTLTAAAAVRGRAADIGIGLPNAALYMGPCIAGHVGADAAAAALAEGPHRTKKPMLVVDVGTNAEIVLGDGRRVLAASSPTGPAFEGAQISCGQRATGGAVERVRIDPDTWEPRFKVIGCELWSHEPGFAEELDRAGLQASGLCGSGIVEVVAEMFLAGVADRHGVISSDVGRSPRIVADGRTFSYVLQAEPIPLSVTQNDVRAVQLAKAALRAGIDLLRERAGVDEAPEIRLAGAFGAHIDPLRAMVLGLVPDTPAGGVRSAGNASGVGAVRMLLSGEQRLEVERMVRSVEKIETATEPRFQELFVAAMAFPHDTEPTPHLAAAIDLPESAAADPGRGSRRRRRPAARASTADRRPRDPQAART